MWQEDCKQGSKIFETYPGHSSFSNTTCGQLCALLEDCQSFIYHFQTASCGLLKVFGGTTKDHDISGPELKLNPKLLIKEHGDYMYLFVNESKRFTEARDYCKGINMTLASIKSAEENRFISDQAVENQMCRSFFGQCLLGGEQNFFKNGSFSVCHNDPCWLGGVRTNPFPTNNAGLDYWKWLSDGLGMYWSTSDDDVYQNWLHGKPELPSTDECMYIHNEKWYAWDCHHDSYPFICKAPKL